MLWFCSVLVRRLLPLSKLLYIMRLIKKQSDGKFKVNKAAVIARLRAMRKIKPDTSIPGLLPVSPREVESIAAELKSQMADSYLCSEETQ